MHVGGTNGKGSVSLKIAKACSLAGLKTGLFTSPHLFAFEERIQISDSLIPQERVKSGLEKLFKIAEEEKITPTFFEMATYLAFDYFREEKVDIAVIEVGMGGRLDATNLIHPLVSIITSISREHVPYLGETLEEIAAEKAGIVKRKVPLVIGPHAKAEAIKQAAIFHCSPLYEVEGNFSFYDQENQAVAKQALSLLSIPSEKGLQYRPLCRFEIKGNMVFDVAHNPDGFKHLTHALEFHFPNEKFRFVLGMSPTKEMAPCFCQIAPLATAFHLVQSKDGLTAPVLELVPYVKKFNIPYFLEITIKEGIAHAKAAKERIVVCGSFYIMQESYCYETQS